MSLSNFPLYSARHLRTFHKTPLLLLIYHKSPKFSGKVWALPSLSHNLFTGDSQVKLSDEPRKGLSWWYQLLMLINDFSSKSERNAFYFPISCIVWDVRCTFLRSLVEAAAAITSISRSLESIECKRHAHMLRRKAFYYAWTIPIEEINLSLFSFGLWS